MAEQHEESIYDKIRRGQKEKQDKERERKEAVKRLFSQPPSNGGLYVIKSGN